MTGQDRAGQGTCVVAVYELLLRQGQVLARHKGIDALHGSCGGEGPAAPAGAVVHLHAVQAVSAG